MPQYKLHYFNVRGRAELSRLILSEAGVEFEDIRYSIEEWVEKKSEMPFGTVPVLEVDGKKLSESITIARYLAREFGLSGRDSWEQAVAESYVDMIISFMAEHRSLAIAVFGKQDDSCAEAIKTFVEKTWPRTMNIFEKVLTENKFLAGDQFTFADLAFMLLMSMTKEVMGDQYGTLKHFERCSEHAESVEQRPNIAAWIEKSKGTITMAQFVQLNVPLKIKQALEQAQTK